MARKTGIFNTVCSICVIFLIFIVSTPLITLAIPTTQLIPLIPTPQPEEMENLPIDLTETNADLPENISNMPEYDIFTYSERQERNLPTILPVTEPFYGDKIIYLTFDDGPDAANTTIVLNILKENNIKATFLYLVPKLKNTLIF